MMCYKHGLGAGKMAHWLRALAALTEGLSSAPSARTKFPSICNVGSDGSHALLWLAYQVPSMYGTHTYMQAKADTYQSKSFKPQFNLGPNPKAPC